eukprot:s491_g21.t1
MVLMGTDGGDGAVPHNGLPSFMSRPMASSIAWTAASPWQVQQNPVDRGLMFSSCESTVASCSSLEQALRTKDLNSIEGWKEAEMMGSMKIY